MYVFMKQVDLPTMKKAVNYMKSLPSLGSDSTYTQNLSALSCRHTVDLSLHALNLPGPDYK